MKRLIDFIDKEEISAVCEKADIDLAINIAATFCADKFGIYACAEHRRAVSSFCASTIYEARLKKITVKQTKQTRAFEIKKDLFNALASACHNGYHPLPILGKIRTPRNKSFIVMPGKDPQEEAQDLNVFRKVGNIFTKMELNILLEQDASVTVYGLMNEYGLNRAEAEALNRNIKQKIFYLRQLQ